MRSADINGYDGKYTLFDDGRVRRNPSKYRRTTMFLKPSQGIYMRVTLYRDSSPKSFSIHRLLAEHFIPNPSNLPQVNHIDGNKYNNSIDNLEWCSAKENLLHSIYALGRKRNSEKQRDSARRMCKTKRKLRFNDAIYIRVNCKSIGRKALSEIYSVSLSTIDRIVNNTYYKGE